MQFVGNDRTRADATHVAPQDVEQLRQLIQARFAKHLSEEQDTRIAAQLLVGRPLLGGLWIATQMPFEHLLGIRHHGAELVAIEGLSIESNAPVNEQRRTACGGLDQKRDQNQDRTGQDERCRGYHQIQQPLGPTAERLSAFAARIVVNNGQLVALPQVTFDHVGHFPLALDFNFSFAFWRRRMISGKQGKGGRSGVIGSVGYPLVARPGTDEWLLRSMPGTISDRLFDSRRPEGARIAFDRQVSN
ncbi:hypothetical protein MES4922_110101 [Mesorhizobium ventifaucium]|uniref:Uncharacterized protein n=1 Tax=Mesorhizobium ventifaucium TaxID=666020 RepID=A0ABM9DDM9_9HYPH|nr:hypothetical protein MES4922_110101 [Mesorhizobium ventifaucium]